LHELSKAKDEGKKWEIYDGHGHEITSQTDYEDEDDDEDEGANYTIAKRYPAV
jgi:hypothetical protein